MPEWISPAIYIAGILVVLMGMLGAYFLGERHHDRLMNDVYEGGATGTGSSHARLSVRFYLFAMFFVIFDIETVFLLIWSGSVRELGFFGFFQASFFGLMLLLALFYLARVGALNAAPKFRRLS